MVLYCVMIFVGLIWALTGLGEARTGVSRIFRELEYDRSIGEAAHGGDEIL
jgi:hypothetical protein